MTASRDTPSFRRCLAPRRVHPTNLVLAEWIEYPQNRPRQYNALRADLTDSRTLQSADRLAPHLLQTSSRPFERSSGGTDRALTQPPTGGCLPTTSLRESLSTKNFIL